MAAEAVAGFYAVESLVEGLAVGALAVSGATAPLKAHFKKLKVSSSSDASSGTTVVIKNKIYVISSDQGQSTIQSYSLRPDYGASRTDVNEPIDVDYEALKPEYHNEERPLKQYSDIEKSSPPEQTAATNPSWSRSNHSTTSIEDRIYLLGGHDPSRPDQVVPANTIVCLDTLRNSYDIITADESKCTEGIPSSLHSASITSSPLPPALPHLTDTGPASSEQHGTIFLHGGVDASKSPLHETWTFDLATRAWHKFPSLPDIIDNIATSEKQSESQPQARHPGQIAYVDHRLWYVDSQTAMYLDLSEHDPAHNPAQSNTTDTSAESSGRVGTGQWQVVYPPAKDDPNSRVQSSSNTTTEQQNAQKDASDLESANLDNTQKRDLMKSQDTSPSFGNRPIRSLLPITTGAGRTYLLANTSPRGMYTFQIQSAPKTATAVKDTIRDKVQGGLGLGEGWKSGMFEWARVEVVHLSSKNEELDIPHTGTSKEADKAVSAAVMPEHDDRIVLWDSDGEGWIVTFS